MDDQTTKHKYPDKPSIIPGMPVAVIVMRRKGQKIPIDELRETEPLLGRLIVELRSASDGRTFRAIACLHRPGLGDIGDVCAPLFDPVLERQDSRGQLLTGYQIDASDGGPAKYGQSWLVRPTVGMIGS